MSPRGSRGNKATAPRRFGRQDLGVLFKVRAGNGGVENFKKRRSGGNAGGIGGAPEACEMNAAAWI